MLKPTHTQEDYTAMYIDTFIQSGSKYSRTKAKKCKTRGRKPKAGRRVRKFYITLSPTDEQETCLFTDLAFFRNIYDYTIERLKEPSIKRPDGLYYYYDVEKKQSVSTVRRREKRVLPHSPGYIMQCKNDIIEENPWMKDATYQVSYRAVVSAYNDQEGSVSRQAFNYKLFSGENSYEAKLCYRIQNGMLFLKKYNQYIKINETIPQGGLEAIRIKLNDDGKWVAEISILDKYDKADDIQEGRNGMLKTDTKKVELKATENVSKKLEEKVLLFNFLSNKIIRREDRITKVNNVLQQFDAKYLGQWDEVHDLKDHGMMNMCAVAAMARMKKFVKTGKKVPISTQYVALSDGFYIKDKKLFIPDWGISIPMDKNLRGKWFDFIIISKNKDGGWELRGSKQDRRKFKNLNRQTRAFSTIDLLGF